MSTRFLKYKMNEVRFPLFKLTYISNTTRPSHKKLVDLCCEVHHMWWVNQYLGLQEWEYCIQSNKTIILNIILLSPNNIPQEYKDHIISFSESQILIYPPHMMYFTTQLYQCFM